MNSYYPVISKVEWAQDSLSVYFIAYTNSSIRRLCKVRIDDRKVIELSSPDSDVNLYSVAHGTVVYSATRSTHAANDSPDPHNSEAEPVAPSVAGMTISDILFPRLPSYERPEPHELWYLRDGHLRQVHPSSLQSGHPEADRATDFMALSPNGRKVIRLERVSQVLASWRDYVPMKGFEEWREADLFNDDPNNIWAARQYVLIDLTSGAEIRLVNAPYARVLAYQDPASAVWGLDGRRILLTGTFLPISRADGQEDHQRVYPCAVASLDLVQGETKCIVFSRDGASETEDNPKPLRLVKASFAATENEVVLRFGWRDQRSQTEWYRYAGGQWILEKTVADDSLGHAPSTEPDALGTHQLIVRISENLNEPPTLWATDSLTEKGREIWNPNPQFASIRYGDESVYHWKDTSGYEWSAGLVKPVGYVAGARYPLVIQTHGFQREEFITDGAYTSGMAARALASTGFVVLQMAPNVTHLGQLREVTDNVLGFSSAIEHLTADGLVDAKRVGIVGFSRTCWYVERALIDDPHGFSAVSLVDGIDHSYMQEMLFRPSWDTSEAQKIYAAEPFGAGLSKWLEKAPSFHLNEFQAPLMISALGPPSILLEWEIYSSLYQQRKPVDLIYLPKAEHILQRPSDRIMSEQVTVDWFRFWLQGYEDTDPGKKGQYKRWEHLRELRDAHAKAAGQAQDDNASKPN